MPRPLVFVLALAAAIPLAAQVPRSHDSAGVRIIETASWNNASATFTVGAAARYDVGGLRDDPDEEFNARNGYLHAVPLASGGMAVIDQNRIQYFDATGKRLRSVGQAGGGPNDFGMLTAACHVHGDTLIAYDNRNRRVSVVSPAGVVLTTVSEPTDYAGGHFCLDDGSFVLTRVVSEADGSRQVVITRHTTDGKSTQIAAFGGAPVDMAFYAEPGVVAEGEMVFAGNTIKNEIMGYAGDGRLTTIVRAVDPVEPITTAQRNVAIESTIPTRVSAAERAERVAEGRSRPGRPTWPAFLRLAADPSGRLWIRLWPRPESPAETWVAVDATGKVVGRLVMPIVTGSRPPWVEAFGIKDIVIGHLDADGATHFTLYPLIAPR